MLCPSASQARPAIRQGFFNVYPNAVGSRLDSVPSKSSHCGVCHYDFNGGGPKNAYGDALNSAGFGGAPVGHHYEDGQYWDDTHYTVPAGAKRAEVKLYYQSTSKEFIEFKDSLTAGTWQAMTNCTFTATNTVSAFKDDFTANTSGGQPPTGQRYYRFRYSTP